MLPKKHRLSRRPIAVRLRAVRRKALPIAPRARTKSSISAEKCAKGEHKGEHGRSETTQELSVCPVAVNPLRPLESDGGVSTSPARSLRLEKKLMVRTISANQTPTTRVSPVGQRCRKEGSRSTSTSSTPELSSVGSVSFKSLVSLVASHEASAHQSCAARKCPLRDGTSVSDGRGDIPAIANGNDVVSPKRKPKLQSKGSIPIQSQESDAVEAQSAGTASLSGRTEKEVVVVEASASSPRKSRPLAVEHQSTDDIDRAEKSYRQTDALTHSFSTDELGSPVGILGMPAAAPEDPTTSPGINRSPGAMEFADLFKAFGISTGDDDDDKAIRPVVRSRRRKHEVVQITRIKKSHPKKKDATDNSFSGHALPVESLRELEVVRSNRTQSPGMTHSRLRKKLVVAPRKTRLWADMSVRTECATGGELAVSISGCLLNTSPGPCKKDRM